MSHRVALIGAILISILTLLQFSALSVLLLVREVPPGSREAALILVGSLANSATLVVGYWVGSSVGSAQKTAILEQKP